jgi:hypothetical protein
MSCSTSDYRCNARSDSAQASGPHVDFPTARASRESPRLPASIKPVIADGQIWGTLTPDNPPPPVPQVASLGIHVTVLALGSFRTDWAGRSMVRAPRSIPDYDAVFDPIRAARSAKSGNQTGDPAATARALLTVLESPNPPVHLVLGPDALRVLEQGRQSFQTDLDAWMGLTMSTDFPADKQ